MTSLQISKKLRMTRENVTIRLKNNGIWRFRGDYTHEEFLVIFYEKYANRKIAKAGLILPSEIKVVEYYLNVSNNTAPEIAKAFDLTIHRVNYILNNFLKNKYVIVESKMNEVI